MGKLFLGVDGGQSSTTALIADETGRVLGGGRGGPCNHVQGPEGREKFVRAVGGSVAEACAKAGLDPGGVRFVAACLGFSGGPADKEPLLGGMLRADRLIVTTDAFIALTGATAGAPGIITIAGTGSISFGRNAAGKTGRAGGWGYIFGDQGGAFDITRQALRAALRFEEGWGPKTLLRERLLEATGARDANDLLHRFYTTDYPRPKIAGYSRIVDECARAGDAVARGIFEKAAQELALLTRAIRTQLFAPREAAMVAYIGGVFRSELLLARFRELAELEEGNRVAAPIHGPAAGAVIEALAAEGLRPPLTGLPAFEK